MAARPIPSLARMLLPESRHFASTEDLNDAFDESWRRLRRNPLVDRFGVIDIVLVLTYATALGVCTYLVISPFVGTSFLLILWLLLLWGVWQSVSRWVRLRRAYIHLLRCELSARGVPVCLHCGSFVGTDHPSGALCPQCNRRWDDAIDERLCRLCVEKEEYKKCRDVIRDYPNLHAALGAIREARSTFRAQSRTPWIAIYITLLSVVILTPLVSAVIFQSWAGVPVGLLTLVIVPVVNSFEQMHRRKYMRRILIQRLVDHGRLVCTECGYDMSVLRDGICPECGATVPHRQADRWRELFGDQQSNA